MGGGGGGGIREYNHTPTAYTSNFDMYCKTVWRIVTYSKYSSPFINFRMSAKTFAPSSPSPALYRLWERMGEEDSSKSKQLYILQ